MGFSERYGYKPVRKVIQSKGMDETLRNKLWSVVYLYYMDNMESGISSRIWLPNNPQHYKLFRSLWMNFYHFPVDDLANYWDKNLPIIRSRFFECPWYEVYDLLEFLNDVWPNPAFVEACNLVMKEGLSGYRFINKEIAPITSEGKLAR